MAWHPVEQHADAACVQLGDEVAEPVRQAVAARRREVAGALVAPGLVERVLGHGQQLDVREAEVRRVRAELLGDLAVAQEAAGRAAAPRAEMNLVDRHRLAQPVPLRSLAHPFAVRPRERALLRRDRRRRRPVLEQRTERVGLEEQLARLAAEDLVLVELAGAQLRNEQLPDAGVAAHAHRMVAAVPVVERADDAHALGVRSPNGEAGARDAVDRELVRAEEAVRVHVIAVREAREVERIDVRLERVRVVELVPRVVEPLPAHAVGRRDHAARARPLEQPAARHALELRVGLHEPGALRVGEVDAHDRVGLRQRMQTEDAARVMEPAAQKSFDVGIAQVRRALVAARARHQRLCHRTRGVRHATSSSSSFAAMRPISRRRMVSQLTRSTVAIVMAGGRGQRLMQLTDNRAKPATPFGGKYRIIDFSLSNCVNSGIRQIFILTQYKAHSLIQHVQRGWGYLHGELGEFIDIVPAQQQLGEIWYRGTADAVYQNLDIIEQHRPETVLVLAGDHVYKMDYGPLIAFHKESGADITIGGVQVPLSQAHEFGVMALGRRPSRR